MALAEDPGIRDVRRLQLARRLVSHHARTRTVCAFTGYTRDKLATLRKRWGVPESARHRGPSPSSFASFFQSPEARSDATTAVVIATLMEAAPPSAPGGKRASINLDGGERLCDAFEAYLACAPAPRLNFEHFLLLLEGVAKGDVITLSACEPCGGLLLIDRLAGPAGLCEDCPRREAADSLTREAKSSGAPPVTRPGEREPEQVDLF